MDNNIIGFTTSRSEYIDAMLQYFSHPSKQLRAVLETKMESFCEEFEDPQLAYDQFIIVITKLERNDFQTWNEFQKEVSSAFNNDNEMDTLFLTIAKERMPSMKWSM